MVDVELSSDEPAIAVAYRVVEKVVASAARELLHDAADGCNLSIRMLGDDEVSRLHATFFGDPDLTDVMSFPSEEAAGIVGAYLGDIAISTSVARTQAQEHGHSMTRETAFLALHGLLHLLGYDDSDDRGKACMLATQTRLLEAFEHEHGTI